MKKSIPKLTVANVLMRMTEKSYRMGCLDANALFNPDLIRNTFEERSYIDLIMIVKGEIREVSHLFFMTNMIVQSYDAGIGNFDIVCASASYKKKLSAITHLLNWYYQKGLRDGSSVSIIPLLDQWDSDPRCFKTLRIHEKPKRKEVVRELVLVCQKMIDDSLFGAKRLMIIFDNLATHREMKRKIIDYQNIND